MFTAKTRAERQRVLRSHYKFDCCCIACEEDWPTMKAMKDKASCHIVVVHPVWSTEIGIKAWLFDKLQPGRARKRINAT